MNRRLIIIVCWLLLSPVVQAMTIKSLDDITTGRMVVQTDTKATLLPLLDTQVNIKIQGLVARAEVRQFFENPSKETIEASYFFPLPEDSAVSKMMMRIGERVIVGQIKEKAEAKRLYTEAKAAGKRAALLEQGRPNLFRNKVANIAPGETIEVLLVYHQPVIYTDSQFSIRFPSTLTPRYQPLIEKHLVENFDVKTQHIQQTPEDIVRSVPAVINAAQSKGHELSIDVELNAGLPIQTILSTNHTIVSKKIADGRFQIGLQNYQVSDRDFELVWQLVPDKSPRLITFDELDKNEPGTLYTQIMLMPPAAEKFQALDRDVTFILDHSGSMEGQPIRQAREAMMQAIQTLKATDQFNIIGFNHDYRSLFGGSLTAEAGTKGWAMAYINDLAAEGGTEMLPALQSALSETPTPDYVRQVVFLTDGAVSNESELFNLIHQSLGDARLFTVGIGAAPNSYFMRKAAQFGRGSYTFISQQSEVASKMSDLLDQLRFPAMHSIDVNFSETVSVFPEKLPDLYQGQPLSLLIRRPAVATQLSVNAERQGLAWVANVNLSGSSLQEPMGIGQLWAREKIAALMDDQHIQNDPKLHRDEIVKLALQHHILTAYTSFVAIEQVVSRPANKALKSHAIPNLTPHGAEHFGYPSTSLDWQRQLFIGICLLALASVFRLRN